MRMPDSRTHPVWWQVQANQGQANQANQALAWCGHVGMDAAVSCIDAMQAEATAVMRQQQNWEALSHAVLREQLDREKQSPSHITCPEPVGVRSLLALRSEE